MDLSQDFISVLNAVTNKRARFVIDTILEKGYCSTEDLKNGGYEHAPRAARDVRELGIPLETYKIKDSTVLQLIDLVIGKKQREKISYLKHPEERSLQKN